jgi:hypothetical protein
VATGFLMTAEFRDTGRLETEPPPGEHHKNVLTPTCASERPNSREVAIKVLQGPLKRCNSREA